MTNDGSIPLALDTQTHHGDWQIPAVHAALRQHRWATVLGRRAFIRYGDVHALIKDGKHLRTPGPDWLLSSGITEGRCGTGGNSSCFPTTANRIAACAGW